jgi:hypothetical protein
MDILKIGELKNTSNMVVSDAITSLPHYVIGASLDENLYIDITSNNNWMNICIGMKDYLFCRNQVKMRTYVIGFDNLSLIEQKTAAMHFATEKENRDKVFTDAEQYSWWSNFMSFAKDARVRRWVEAKIHMAYVLPINDSIDLAKTTNELSYNFTEYGIEAYAIDGVTGLYDWLQSTGEYSGSTGFASKSYWNQGYEDKIIEIIRDGIY